MVSFGTFEKDEETREATSAENAVLLRYTGWREAEDKPAKVAKSTVKTREPDPAPPAVAVVGGEPEAAK